MEKESLFNAIRELGSELEGAQDRLDAASNLLAQANKLGDQSEIDAAEKEVAARALEYDQLIEKMQALKRQVVLKQESG